MPQKQNPTDEGRVLWNSLVGASTESLTLSTYRAQHLICTYGIRPDVAAMLAGIAFGGGAPMAEAFTRFPNAGQTVAPGDAVTEFLDAMGAAGIHPVEPIALKLASGDPVRFRADGDKPGRRNGWAWLHLDGVPAGVFRHYRLGIRTVWRSGSQPSAVSPAERRAIMVQAREYEARSKADTLAKQEAAAGIAQDLWRSSGKADPAHGYLVRKGLTPFGIRQNGQALLVPMFDAAFRLWNVQCVYQDGRKLFFQGGRTAGLFWPHGAFQQVGKPSAGPLVLGEGFATLAAIHLATGYGVVAAMSAGNLQTVACSMRKLFPSRTLVVAADDDRHLEENIGLNAARAAAESIGGLLAVPVPPEVDSSSVTPGGGPAASPAAEVSARAPQSGGLAHA